MDITKLTQVQLDALTVNVRNQMADVGVGISAFGAVGDGRDDSDAFKRAIEASDGRPLRIILNASKTYGIKNTVTLPYNVSIEGNHSKIVPLSGGSLKDGYMFYVNSTLDNTTIESWGGEIVTAIENLKLDNPNGMSGVKGFYTRGKTNFKNITFRRMYKGILKEGSSDKDYSDMMHLEMLYFVNCLGTDALIDIRYNGDGFLVDRCHTAGVAEGNYNLLNLEFSNGGKIIGCINGDIRINKSTAISIENFHCEHGKIEIISSHVALRDIHQWYHKTYQPVPLTIIGAATDKPANPCVIENYNIIHPKGRTGMAKNYTDAEYFDAYIKNANVKIMNFFRRTMFTSDPSFGMSSAAKVSFDGTTISDAWEKASQMYSKNSYLVDDKIFTDVDEVEFEVNPSLFSVLPSSHTSFDEAAGTYYYATVYFFGPSDRAVARWGSAAQSVTIADPTKQVPYLNIQYRPELQLSKIRVFRGAASGQYTHYVDVPVGNGLNIYDLGFYLSTGERWKTRTAGPIGTVINPDYTKIRMSGDKVEVTGTAPPTQGTWTKGDRIVNSNRAEAGTDGSKYVSEGWECVTAGAPGTWVERRYLTGN